MRQSGQVLRTQHAASDSPSSLQSFSVKLDAEADAAEQAAYKKTELLHEHSMAAKCSTNNLFNTSCAARHAQVGRDAQSHMQNVWDEAEQQHVRQSTRKLSQGTINDQATIARFANEDLVMQQHHQQTMADQAEQQHQASADRVLQLQQEATASGQRYVQDAADIEQVFEDAEGLRQERGLRANAARIVRHQHISENNTRMFAVEATATEQLIHREATAQQSERARSSTASEEKRQQQLNTHVEGKQSQLTSSNNLQLGDSRQFLLDVQAEDRRIAECARSHQEASRTAQAEKRAANNRLVLEQKVAQTQAIASSLKEDADSHHLDVLRRTEKAASDAAAQTKTQQDALDRIEVENIAELRETSIALNATSLSHFTAGAKLYGGQLLAGLSSFFEGDMVTKVQCNAAQHAMVQAAIQQLVSEVGDCTGKSFVTLQAAATKRTQEGQQCMQHLHDCHMTLMRKQLGVRPLIALPTQGVQALGTLTANVSVLGRFQRNT